MRNLFIISAIMMSISWGAIASSQEESPQQAILSSSYEVLDSMKKFRKQNVEDTEILGDALLRIIEPIMDFEAIARAVMGKHYKLATPQQKSRFNPIFKKTMAKLYAKALVRFEINSVSIDEKKSSLSDTKGKIATKVVASDETIYSIVYTLRKNSHNKWRVRNIVLDGINLGLTYRNQFYSLANRYNGDIDKVIDNWSENLDVQ